MDTEKPEQLVQKRGISIGQLSRLTGASEATLRMWERRHGLLQPARLPGGHRRYSEGDVDVVRRVLADRAAGVPLATAVARARDRGAQPARSIYAVLLRRRPDLQPQRLNEGMMLALSRAIEDESLSRAERPVMFGCFQRERFYRRSQARWRDLSRGARFAAVFADFANVSQPADGPVEVPLGDRDPLTREWAVICDGEGHSACLFGWEPPAGGGGSRVFDAVWSVEPGVVRDAAVICAEVAGARVDLPGDVAARLQAPAAGVGDEQLRLATAITARALGHLQA